MYVLNDGGEVDLDLGNYERYLNVTLNRDNNITTGKIYREVIEKEVSTFLVHSFRRRGREDAIYTRHLVCPVLQEFRGYGFKVQWKRA